MPWVVEAMKDALDCDKLWGAVREALIRRFPNGETQCVVMRITLNGANLAK